MSIPLCHVNAIIPVWLIARNSHQCRVLEFLKVVGAVDTIRDLSCRCKTFLEDFIETASTGGNEAEIGALYQPLMSDESEAGTLAELTLGLSTFDWYSAWNCVPTKYG